MQTFVPSSAGYKESAQTLDNQRLGKQRVETLQIINTLLDPQYGWRSHPAVHMWDGHTAALCTYGEAICQEWSDRGMIDNVGPQMRALREIALALGSSNEKPEWWGNEALHDSHKSNLIRKDASYYSQKFPTIDENQDYIWPVASLTVPTRYPFNSNTVKKSGVCQCKTNAHSFEAIRTRKGTGELQGPGTWWRCIQCHNPNKKWLNIASSYLQDHILQSNTKNTIYSSKEISLKPSILNGYNLKIDPTSSLFNNTRYFIWSK